jgi:hypothetical protein
MLTPSCYVAASSSRKVFLVLVLVSVLVTSLCFRRHGFGFGLGLGGPVLGLCVISSFLFTPPLLGTRSIESCYGTLVLSSESSCSQKYKSKNTYCVIKPIFPSYASLIPIDFMYISTRAGRLRKILHVLLLQGTITLGTFIAFKASSTITSSGFRKH